MKPKIHKSALNMYERCSMQYFYRYCEGIIKPPAVAMILGTGVHKSSAEDLTAKRDKGALLSLEEVKATAADAVNKEWDESGVELDEKEKLIGEKNVRGNTVDQAIKLAGLHHKELAPNLKPKHIERPFTVELKNFPVDLSGRLDLQEEDTTLRDLKTRKNSPPEGLADGSLDLGFYGLAAMALDGEPPKSFALDFLVKTKFPRLVTQTTTRGNVAYTALLMRIEAICRAIENGAFTPCSADHWLCCERWCGYYSDLCPYGARARVTG